MQSRDIMKRQSAIAAETKGAIERGGSEGKNMNDLQRPSQREHDGTKGNLTLSARF
jgi:hypothetical protein